MSKIKLQPSEEMIKAGILELKELSVIEDAYFRCRVSDEELEDAVVFLWQAMVSNYK